jgi:hypothetical protein
MKSVVSWVSVGISVVLGSVVIFQAIKMAELDYRVEKLEEEEISSAIKAVSAKERVTKKESRVKKEPRSKADRQRMQDRKARIKSKMKDKGRGGLGAEKRGGPEEREKRQKSARERYQNAADDVAFELDLDADVHAELGDLLLSYVDARHAISNSMQAGDIEREDGRAEMEQLRKDTFDTVAEIVGDDGLTLLQDRLEEYRGLP